MVSLIFTNSIKIGNSRFYLIYGVFTGLYENISCSKKIYVQAYRGIAPSTPISHSVGYGTPFCIEFNNFFMCTKKYYPIYYLILK